jgi:TRAP-type C4-dicarboxylate transport system substrate-binding protein
MPAGNKERELFLMDTTGVDSEGKEWAGLPSWQRKASEKAIEKYTEAQEKKWRRWNEAMFERSG